MGYAFGKQYMAIRTVKLAKLSMLLNAFIALGKIGVGIYSFSLFLCVGGFYNIGIGLAKYIMVKSHNETEQRRHYKWVGIIILVASAVYMVYCGNMAVQNKANISYSLITGITIATFTFTEIGMAAYGIWAAKKMKNLTLSAAKKINLVTALVSVVLTQSALLGLSGVENAARYCGWVGLLFGGISAIVGLLMILEVRRKKSSPLPE